MTIIEAEAVRAELAALVARAHAAEQCATHSELRAIKAEAERDTLRALLSRLRTSLAESFNDPGASA